MRHYLELYNIKLSQLELRRIFFFYIFFARYSVFMGDV